ncbi:hypothetical protein LYNGBM3L_23570 [Moorena producens 3L]|uniref:Uncharacterized protein n=2 Tax=Coleofasciculaceae TaxID=1892251 RepID=F4XN82_9CYAN|nr:hypothetical protein LYNGBM3L_23570 [Moorena producens 3L]OLT65103.1 hypothetical protein BI334_08700 [Moorena producens 3L]
MVKASTLFWREQVKVAEHLYYVPLAEAITHEGAIDNVQIFILDMLPLLPITYYLLPITYYLLPITYYPNLVQMFCISDMQAFWPSLAIGQWLIPECLLQN